MSQPGEGLLAPPHGELRVVDDVPLAFRELFEEVTVLALESRIAPESPLVTVALSGGETARACYEGLAGSDVVPWPRIECFIGDERCVAPDDADANQKMIRQALIDHVEVAAFHPMDCSRAEEYGKLMAERQGLDLVHLGLGPDGHTASLFPGSVALSAPGGALVAHNTDPSGRNKHDRLTLTFEAISRASLAVFTVSGAGKHDALHAVLSGADLPAAQVNAERVVWLCDGDALGEDIDRVR